MKPGIAALGPDIDAVMVLLADLPAFETVHLNRLMRALDPQGETSIVRAYDETGQPGHPVLFTRRHFEELMALRGDRGAADLIRSHAGRLAQLVLPGRAASLDLDTPEDWARFETTGE